MVFQRCNHDKTSWQGTYSSLPKIGARPLICMPRAARTCCDVSDTKSSILVIISLRRVSRSNNPQKPSEVRKNTRRSRPRLLTRYLTSYGGTNFRLRIFKQLNESWNKISCDGLVIYRFRDLRNHHGSISLKT